MKRVMLILLANCAIAQTEALLPPLYKGSAELKAILSDEELGRQLGSGDVITKIERTTSGYEITTNKHHLQVYVDHEPAQRPGPALYKIRFGEATPL